MGSDIIGSTFVVASHNSNWMHLHTVLRYFSYPSECSSFKSYGITSIALELVKQVHLFFMVCYLIN